ncbi:MAG: diaminopimelate epimerase [Myxococcales bacterium]|nr:diaminopimelate epimerase [Myxococcales bacterium]
MELLKAHGLGNDYLVLERGPALTPALVRQLCDRHRGVGADGILEPRPTDAPGAFGVRIWNPDGSIAEKSGNGLRIFAHWHVHVRGSPTPLQLDTGHDVVSCEVHGDEVTVEMGTVTFAQPPRRTLHIEGKDLDVTVLDVGNPHTVVWVDEADLDALPWRSWGAALERHELFAHRTNVQIATLTGGTLRARIWERGAGETQASGSSACAVAAAAVQRGQLTPDAPTRVHMPGGTLEILVRTDRTVRLRGPVAAVARIHIPRAWYPAEAGGSEA